MGRPPRKPQSLDQPRRQGLRTPSRSRGILRYEALVDATEALLSEYSVNEVGLYQIAERARARPATVYHFFPTKEAAFLALTLRYMKALNDNGRMPIPADALDGWQSLMKWDQRNAAEYFNARPPALKLLYGGYGGIETRPALITINNHLSQLTYLRLSQAFHMPMFRDADRKFHICLEMINAVWSISYLYEGRISDAYFEEAHAACVAYCRLFLPERVELLDEHAVALSQHKRVILPPLPPLEPHQVVKSLAGGSS